MELPTKLYVRVAKTSAGQQLLLASDDLAEVVRDADTEIGRYVLVEKQHYTKQVVPFPAANPRKKGRAA